MIEGKTKIIRPISEGSEFALVTTKDDITAGDGAKHDLMVGKAELATRTTCNVFEYLSVHQVPLAYVGRCGPTTFQTRLCQMIPVEVVVRGVAKGSYIKRNPEVLDGHRFDEPVVEFFYKTTGRHIGDLELPCDDPLMIIDGERRRFDLYLPNKPVQDGYIRPLPISREEFNDLASRLHHCRRLAKTVFLLLEAAWFRQQGTLHDFKLEFGVLPSGLIVVADVIDCDSWRVVRNGIQLSKQGYRDGDDLNKVMEVYRLAADLTDRFI